MRSAFESSADVVAAEIRDRLPNWRMPALSVTRRESIPPPRDQPRLGFLSGAVAPGSNAVESWSLAVRSHFVKSG